MNEPLQRRGGSNIGVVPAFVPRFKNSLAECFPVVLGDMLLWNGPPKDGESRALGQATFFNYGTVNYHVDLYLVGVDGKEFFVDAQTIAGVPVPPGTNSFQFLGIAKPVVLIKGEKLIARITGPGYVGGGFVQTDSAVLYQVQSDRQDITQTLKKMVEPPDGKGLGSTFGPFPIILVNTDSVNHLVDVYFNDDAEGPDSLVWSGVTLFPDSPLQLNFSSLSYDQMLKAQIREPLVDADAVVRWFSMFLEYDLGVVDSD